MTSLDDELVRRAVEIEALADELWGADWRTRKYEAEDDK